MDNVDQLCIVHHNIDDYGPKWEYKKTIVCKTAQGQTMTHREQSVSKGLFVFE